MEHVVHLQGIRQLKPVRHTVDLLRHFEGTNVPWHELRATGNVHPEVPRREENLFAHSYAFWHFRSFGVGKGLLAVLSPGDVFFGIFQEFPPLVVELLSRGTLVNGPVIDLSRANLVELPVKG